MTYVNPTDVAPISSSWQDHKNRTPPSQEPGTDIAVAYGANAYAVMSGTIVDVKTTTSSATGRYVTLDADNGHRFRYLHLSRVLVAR